MALIRRERPDVVHANSSKAGVLGRVAALLMRVPVRVFTVHGWAFKAYAGLPSRLYLWADRLMSPLDLRHDLRLRDGARGRFRGADLPSAEHRGHPERRRRGSRAPRAW